MRAPTHRQFRVDDIADVGAIRRAIRGYAAPPDRAALAELAATELATNLLRHARPGGWILIRPVPPDAVEILAVDHGPGIADPAAALDGRTSAPAGLGRGLLAVRRASSVFDVHTRPGAGTAVLSVVSFDGPPAGPAPARRLGGVQVALTEACGDGWAATDVDGLVAVVVADGLGHGVAASVAADAALHEFAAAPTALDSFVERANKAMRETRGAAVAAVVLDPDEHRLRYVVVGNVSGKVVHQGESRGLVGYSGTLGLGTVPPRSRVGELPWPPGASLVLWTDGLTTRVDPTADPDLLTHDPALVAAVLHREHTRRRDDATVVVVHNPAAAT